MRAGHGRHAAGTFGGGGAQFAAAEPERGVADADDVLFRKHRAGDPLAVDVCSLVGVQVDDLGAAVRVAAQFRVMPGDIEVRKGIPATQLRAALVAFAGRGLVQAVVDLPLVVPHTVAGIALLFLLGRTGWVGAPAGHLGISFYGTQLGIIAAMLFVSAPFAVNSARVAFEAIDPRLEQAARSLGATPCTRSAVSPCRWGCAAC
jgi:ABC-type sulfate transport system permease subunit